jgi:hypothetical protein
MTTGFEAWLGADSPPPVAEQRRSLDWDSRPMTESLIRVVEGQNTPVSWLSRSARRWLARAAGPLPTRFGGAHG